MSISTSKKDIVVFSGGSAANSLVDVFNSLVEDTDSILNYILPISDNGGSSSEIIRVFGGPGIGDVRSRLIRLIPSPSPVQALLNHRLPSVSHLAHHEWSTIVEGTSPLWLHISQSQKELVRSFLNYLNLELIKRARPSSTFDFSSASIGNMFLTGARLFTGSFESAISLFGMIGGVNERTRVIPAINANWTCHIAAGLVDGTMIVGQNSISHPSAPTALPDAAEQDQHPPISPSAATNRILSVKRRQASLSLSESDSVEDAYAPGTLPTLRKPQIDFSKSFEEPLPAAIDRIWYINPYGSEIRPSPNPAIVDVLHGAKAIVYSIGSLYTSLLPNIILRGVGRAITEDASLLEQADQGHEAGNSMIRIKILLLNGSLDRETGLGLPECQQMTAADFVRAIVRAGQESQGIFNLHFTMQTAVGRPQKEDDKAVSNLAKSYITHLIYIEGKGVPKVDKPLLSNWGIECVKCFGRDGKFDGPSLSRVLRAVIGRRGVGRRMTLEK